ncbi:hypothetical protein AAHC03_013523 [Spirometra sp. Aus1]
MDHPEPISKRVPEIPQCRKGFTLEEARGFVDRVMQVFHGLEDMTDLRSMYETGKQLSRLYFDCHQYRIELAQYLTSLDYPAFASKMMKKLNNMGVFKNDNIWFSSFYFYNTTWNFSEIWPDFATALANAGLPNLLNLNIGHQPYLDNLPSKNVYYLVKASLSIIHNIARIPGNVHCFASETVKTALLNRCLRDEAFLCCISDLCLAYIVNDSDTSLITSPNNTQASPPSILHCLFDHVATAKASEKRRCHSFQVYELLSALATLAVNDSIKSDILAFSSGMGSERVTCFGLVKEAVDAALQPSPPVSAIREAEEVVRLLWNLALGGSAIQSELNQQAGAWLSSLLRDSSRCATLPTHIVRALEAISSRLSCPGTPSTPGGSQIVVSFAPANRLTAAKIAERLQSANLPVHMLETTLPDADSTVADASAVGLSGVYLLAQSHAAWKKILDSASILVVCASEAYRLSPGCRQEVECFRSSLGVPVAPSGGDAAFRQSAGKQILPVSLQAKYRPTGWLSEIIGGQTLIDLSGRRDLDSGLENFVLQAQDLYADVKQFLDNMSNDRKQSVAARDPQPNHVDGLSSSNRNMNDAAAPGLLPSGGPMLGVSCATSLGRDGSLPKVVAHPRGSIFQTMAQYNSMDAFVRACRSAVRPDVRNWSTHKVASWLKFRGNGQILQVTGAFDGLILSQLAALRFWAPEYFARSLQSELHLSFIDGLRLVEALDELAPGAAGDDCYGEGVQDNYDDRADAYSHVSGCDNMGPR